jgi:hypothetical protein
MRKYLFPLPGIDPQTLGRPDRSLLAIPTETSGLYIIWSVICFKIQYETEHCLSSLSDVAMITLLIFNHGDRNIPQETKQPEERRKDALPIVSEPFRAS